MASKPVANLSAAEKEQLAVSYAAFIISSQGGDISADSINSVLKAANIAASDSIVKAFAKSLSGKKATDFVGAIAGGAPASSPAADNKADSKPAAKDKGGKSAPPPPPPPADEEEEMDMGELFD